MKIEHKDEFGRVTGVLVEPNGTNEDGLCGLNLHTYKTFGSPTDLFLPLDKARELHAALGALLGVSDVLTKIREARDEYERDGFDRPGRFADAVRHALEGT